jgi:hypothetical protein
MSIQIDSLMVKEYLGELDELLKTKLISVVISITISTVLYAAVKKGLHIRLMTKIQQKMNKTFWKSEVRNS